MRKVKVYYQSELLAEYNVRKVFEETFYHTPIETLSAQRCREILNKIYPHFKAEKVLLTFEWVDSGYRWSQEIYRKGTILNG